ncbi:MAG: hypothetical protein A2514_09850 [Gammaproteobacteria bacterium RIFOXYD12_FULL_61_37]|nr:MAG: hypothetical protein A2514_09850 [Gammaproteobacteria bacterium RIFOXYD12_FULL_61_37]
MTDDNKLPLPTPNPADDLLAQLREAAPQIFSEGKIDLDKFKAALGEHIDPRIERYGLNWAGKSDAFRNVQQPSVGTLLPMPDQSVDWNSTENLIIEGDNLEVLKLLQKPYHGKVKMIYIDPPYNTGNEFIYPDNYREGLDDYLRYSGQVSEAGIKQSTNTETSGRFHSKWLNMMYPRLFLARNLLRDDGVVFVSIDDNEVHNLRMLMNEVFGEENFIGQIVWKNVTDNNPTNISTEHEYILCLARSKNDIAQVWKSSISDVKQKLIEIGKSLNSKHTDAAQLTRAYADWFRQNKAFLAPLDRYKHIDLGGVYIGSQSVHNPGREGYRYDVIHPVTKEPCKQPLMGYRFPKETMNKLLAEDRIIFGEDHRKIIELKVYASEYEDKLASVIQLDSRLGSYELKDIFTEVTKIFDNPKSSDLLAMLMAFTVEKEDVVLDFFAGSGTTAHAVLGLNQQDGGNRKFILVQLPEKTDNPQYPTIADITRERVRRVIAKLNQGDEGQLNLEAKPDRGFRAFKLSSSNFKIWDAAQASTEPEQLALQLRHYTNNVDDSRSQQDILFELILKAGLPLVAKVEQVEVEGNPVFSVAEGQLLICLENPITQAVLRGMIAREPLQILCLDTAFHGNDPLKTNAVLEARSHGITFRTV